MDKNQIHSPNYYVKRRLFQNKPAVLGIAFILFSILLALLGYLIMPDQTPNANDGAVQIQKRLPGFEATLLKVRKNVQRSSPGIFEVMFFGRPSEFSIVPIKTYEINNFVLTAEIYGKQDYYQEFNLVQVVVPLYVGFTDALNEDGRLYEIIGNKVKYVDCNEIVVETSQADLVNELEQNHFEKRKYLLGTDKAGRDILSRLLFGTRISLSIGFVSVLISLLLGVTLGSLGGFFGGRIDSFIMWLMSVIWSIPGIMLVISISMALQSRGVWVAFIAVGLTMWVDVARVIRGQIIAIKEKQFVEAARAFGYKDFRIMYKHIMPNILGPLIVIATANFAAAILLEAGLSFLGLSVQPPTPSWGIMIYEGYQSIGTKNSWHLVVFPALAISTMVLAFNLLGNGLRDAFDPKTTMS